MSLHDALPIGTLAPRGQRVVMRCSAAHDRVSTISCVTLSPQARHVGLYFGRWMNQNVHGEEVVESRSCAAEQRMTTRRSEEHTSELQSPTNLVPALCPYTTLFRSAPWPHVASGWSCAARRRMTGSRPSVA